MLKVIPQTHRYGDVLLLLNGWLLKATHSTTWRAKTRTKIYLKNSQVFINKKVRAVKKPSAKRDCLMTCDGRDRWKNSPRTCKALF